MVKVFERNNEGVAMFCSLNNSHAPMHTSQLLLLFHSFAFAAMNQHYSFFFSANACDVSKTLSLSNALYETCTRSNPTNNTPKENHTLKVSNIHVDWFEEVEKYRKEKFVKETKNNIIDHPTHSTKHKQTHSHAYDEHMKRNIQLAMSLSETYMKCVWLSFRNFVLNKLHFM